MELVFHVFMRRFTSQSCSQQIYRNCVTPSCQYGSKSWRNVSTQYQQGALNDAASECIFLQFSASIFSYLFIGNLPFHLSSLFSLLLPPVMSNIWTVMGFFSPPFLSEAKMLTAFISDANHYCKTWIDRAITLALHYCIQGRHYLFATIFSIWYNSTLFLSMASWMSLIFIMDRRDLASASVKSACGHAILRTTFAHSVTSIQDGNWQTEEIYHQNTLKNTFPVKLQLQTICTCLYCKV